jgi:hypothetical protein
MIICACKKDDRVFSLKDDRIKLLTKERWQLVRFSETYLNPSGSADTIFLEQHYPFDLEYLNDDFIVCNQDLTFEWNNSFAHSLLDTSHVDRGTWRISEAGDTLEFNFKQHGNADIFISINYEISGLDASTLILLQDYGFGKSIKTFAHLP